MMRVQRSKAANRGFALLTVLGAVVILSAVALALSSSVRTEIVAATNRTDDLRAYYLAQAGLEEALFLLTNVTAADVPTRQRLRAQVGARPLRVELGGGEALVTLRSEAGKLNLNQADEDQLRRLLAILGVNEDEARRLALAIVQWRSPQTESGEDFFDRYYRSLPEPYEARHAPFRTVEELLLVRGMTREILYGTFELNDEGRVIHRGGLAEYLTTYTNSPLLDANSASYEVLRAIGVSESGARSILAARAVKPFATPAELQAAISSELAASRLSTAPGDTLELVATGQMKGSPVRRSIRTVVKLDVPAANRYRVLAWFDQSPQWEPPEETK